MKRMLGFCLLLGATLALLGVAPVAAGARQGVAMTVTTTLDAGPGAFTATGIPGCTSGSVTDANAVVQFIPSGGIYAGDKVFNCGAGNGFVVRLNAQFGSTGAIGSWSVVSSLGSAAGMSGAGKLTGVPFEGGITDYYVGAVR